MSNEQQQPDAPQPVPTPYDVGIEAAIAASEHPETIIAAHNWRVGYRRALSDYGITLPPTETVTLPLAKFTKLVTAAEAISIDLYRKAAAEHGRASEGDDLRDALAEVLERAR